MISPLREVQRPPEQAYQHKARVLRGWVIALAVTVAVGTLILGGLIVRLSSTTPFPVVVSSPRDCRLSEDADAPKLYIAVDLAAMSDGSLMNASPINPRDRGVAAVGVVSSLPPLSALDDAEIMHIAHEAEENETWFGDDESTGVLVAVVDTGGQTSGHLQGLRTTWALGEPAVQQDLPLGVKFTPTTCTVTTAG